jgi:hypothetical protein
MINTPQIKHEQLGKSYFSRGIGPEIILVMGSCRVVNFVNYLVDWNEANGNRYTICSLDPFNWNWDMLNARVDYDAAILKCEDDAQLYKMFRQTSIFIHEWYHNAGMFNVNKDDNKNIYQFGMDPHTDICIPNWNDVFVLFNDIVSFDIDIRKRAIQDYNVNNKLSPQLQQEIFQKGQKNLLKFYDICDKTSLPEFKTFFQNNMTRKRLFWTYNHSSKWFTLELMRLMDEKFLHIGIAPNPNHEDMFANNYTRLSEYDVAHYNFRWDEDIVPLKEKLF